jgi:NAD(P)-dependent dehydrogenase (short-subunit alcohol dehydrogenase family)/SAM-dependent methyltransferase
MQQRARDTARHGHRVVLVTGAGRGIGRACALAFARAGYAVGLTARTPEQLDRTRAQVAETGARACAVPADVTDPADVDRLREQVVRTLGEIDVLLNNAAYAGPMQPFWDTEPDQWRQALMTNVVGPVLLMRAVLSSMRKRGHGHVINMNSLQGSDPSGSPLPYGVSKAALMRLTDGLAGQLAGSGVVVVDLSPGLVRTAMTAGRPDLDALPESAWAQPDAAARQAVALASGRYDGLTGRFVRAADDLDALAARVAGDPDARILRLVAREVAREEKRMPDTAAESALAFERFQLIANGPALFSAVVAGLELDIFGFLARRPDATCDELAESTGVPRHQLRVLMLTLCATGAVCRQGGRYRNSEIGEQCLAPHSPDSWRHIFLSRQATDYPAFPHTTRALRAGTNLGLAVHPGTGDSLYERLAADPAMQEALHASIQAFTLRTLPALLDNPELASIGHLLDVGGGTGMVAAGFAARFPDAKVTVFDLPSVTEKLAARTLAGPLAARVQLKPGDLFADPFPAAADGVLFCHVLEVCSPEQVRALLAKACEVLPAGGTVLIYSFTAPDAEDAGVLAAQLSLYLNVLATGTGMAYPVRDYQAWLREAGCEDVRAYTGLPYEHSLIAGTRR